MQSFSHWRMSSFAIAAILLPLGLGVQETDTNGGQVDAVRSSPSDAEGIVGYELTENIRGRQFFNALGEEIGDISGIIVSGDRITHVVISISDFVGLGGSDVVVPFGVLRFDADEVTIDTLSSPDQLEELTLFDPNEFGMSD